MKTRFQRAATSLSVLILLSPLPGSIFAQATSGAILGTVVDSNGAVDETPIGQ